ncbi:MAG: class I SAM-dependent methyltransferase [Candidatus Omnitrophota bacterium]
MYEIISKILSGTLYDQGFKIDGKTYPFYSFCQPNSKTGWSDQMAEQLEKPSKNHFIDRYNRKVALDGIRSKLVGENCCYLDMGCSSGHMLEEVLKNFPKVNAIGADYFSAGLLQCHQRLPDIPLFQVDLVNCGFPEKIFDAATCLNVLEHIKDDTTALKQLFRIIKPGGKLVVTVPMGRRLYDIYDQVHRHVRRYKIGEFKDKIESTGFDILKINYFGVFAYPGFYLVKQTNKWRYRRANDDEKKQVVFKQIHDTMRSVLMEKLCSVEYFLGKRIKYPFGIRGYVIAQKPEL